MNIITLIFNLLLLYYNELIICRISFMFISLNSDIMYVCINKYFVVTIITVLLLESVGRSALNYCCSLSVILISY